MNKIILNKKDGSNVDAILTELDMSYIDKIMKLQKSVYEKMPNKDFYASSEKEEFENVIKGNGKIVGCVNSSNDELIAMGVYVEYGYNEHNYGYDVNIEADKLLKVGQLESTVVLENYRGNKLQKLICKYLEDVGKESGMKYICATVAPDNKYSLNTVLELGYKIMLEKLKYGGLKRYILMKEI